MPLDELEHTLRKAADYSHPDPGISTDVALRHLINRVEVLISRLSEPANYSAFTFGLSSEGENALIRHARLPLPDPRLVRRIIRSRQLRGQFLRPELFADPAWDMLLDLTAARAEHKRVSITSLCIASGVPSTTALRWIQQLVDEGWFERVEDDTDRRRTFIALTDNGADVMARYFHELSAIAGHPV